MTFLLKGLPVNSSTTIYNQKFFEIAQLSPKSHSLEVVYEGTNDSTPLNLHYLIIQNGTSSSFTTTSISSSSTTMSLSSLPTSTSTGNIASATISTSTAKSILVSSIIGGVIGGLALVVFAILGFFLLCRRQKRDEQEEISTSTVAVAGLLTVPGTGRTVLKTAEGRVDIGQDPCRPGWLDSSGPPGTALPGGLRDVERQKSYISMYSHSESQIIRRSITS